jgi:hypothetical protein
VSPGAITARLRRRRSRSLLARKRKQVLKQSHAVAHHLQQALTSNAQQLPTAPMNELRATLAKLRHEVLHEHGGHAKLVAGALQELEVSLEQLAKANAASDGNAALVAIGKSKKALDAARDKASEAGDDWPL